ncbi:MAG: beta-N-acetylhexosaminidase [Pseudorhodobacter sp.]|nr:beta-N-acetylhexosaminidase [Pseudorhodobacter sp.]
MSVGRGAAILGCAGPVLLPEERAFFAEHQPFGFILFARNVENPAQLRRLTADLRDAVGRDAPILVDQEGGRVQRLRAPHWTEWSPPLDFVQAAGPNAVRAMELRARLIARELLAVGIDANCAPVCDIITDSTHPFLRNRCYGADPAQVSVLAAAVARGHLAEGVLPVAKHMPGHGRTTVDAHHDLPTVTAPREQLTQQDFAPFRAVNTIPMAMTGHLIFTAYDPDHPATQSPTMIRVIREEIGFHGLLMTDDLNMQALSGTLAQRTALSIRAGCDLALHCKGDLAEMLQVATAAGDMTPQTLQRAEAALNARRTPDPVDIADLTAELSVLMAGTTYG